jgi:hypothetical protein
MHLTVNYYLLFIIYLFIIAKQAFITVKITRTFHAFPNRFQWLVLCLCLSSRYLFHRGLCGLHSRLRKSLNLPKISSPSIQFVARSLCLLSYLWSTILKKEIESWVLFSNLLWDTYFCITKSRSRYVPPYFQSAVYRRISLA